MYAKLIVALCAVGIARAGGLYGAAPVAYSAIANPAVVTKTIAPGVSSYSAYTTDISHGSPVATYAASPVAAYAAAPVVAKAYAAPAYASYSTNVAHGSPVATYAAAAPNVAYSAPAVASYAAPSVLTKTIAPAVNSYAYSTDIIDGAAYAPAGVAAYAAAPIAPLVKSVQYSAPTLAYDAHAAW